MDLKMLLNMVRPKMDEKLSSTVTEGRVTIWTKRFQLGSSDEKELDESEYCWVDG
jgi:hypothetical protein